MLRRKNLKTITGFVWYALRRSKPESNLVVDMHFIMGASELGSKRICRSNVQSVDRI